jgi:hypothetical protein
VRSEVILGNQNAENEGQTLWKNSSGTRADVTVLGTILESLFHAEKNIFIVGQLACRPNGSSPTYLYRLTTVGQSTQCIFPYSFLSD